MAVAQRALRIVLLFVIVSGSAVATEVVQILDGPTLTMNPNGMTPLAGVVEMETDTPVQVELTISDGIDLWTVTFPDSRQVHYLPVLGLKPDRSYTVEVRIQPGGLIDSLLAVTDPLPVDFPVLTVVSNPAEMEPGLTLLDCFQRPGDNATPVYPMIVDSAGEVVWYGDSPSLTVRAIRQLENGNLFFLGGSTAKEMDLLGNWVLRTTLQRPGAGLHHDLFPTLIGTHLSLDHVPVVVTDYPSSVDDPEAPTQTVSIRDDPIVEFFPDGTVREQWLLSEMLDTTRIGYLSLRGTPQGFDWAHANAVIHDPVDDSIIVSVRHQDAVIKFSRTTGELIWILGNHDNWSPEFSQYLLNPVSTPFRWQYAQHAMMLTGERNLVLFDNGNNRASPFDGNPVVPDENNFSRGVEYEIDEELMEVRQIWEYGESIAAPLYSRYISDADWQPVTGNVMMTFGGVTYTGGVSSQDLGLGVEYARIVEVTDEVVPQVVFDLMLYEPTGATSLYRSERIPGLYPQQYLKPPNGVGSTLRLGRNGDSTALMWVASAVDGTHDEAKYYVVYGSDSPDSGFSILETVGLPQLTLDSGVAAQFFKIIAGNSMGMSGNAPAP